jgi:hypothetical protein
MRLFVFFIISVFACSCNKAVLKNATLEARRPPNIYGNNKTLEAGNHISVSAEFTASDNNINMPVYGYAKLGDRQEISADYSLIDDSWGLQSYFINKRKNDFYFGGGVGFQGFPYAFLNIGLNKKDFEVGHAILLGVGSLKLDYEGYYENEDGENAGDFSNTEYSGNMSAYLYTSVYFFERFALNYVLSYTIHPSNFSHNYEDNSCVFECKVDINFNTPDLYIQDIGIVYAGNHIRYRIGLNQIRSYKLPKRYWGTSFNVAWLY